MMPQFLQTLMGYTAESAGLVLSASGVLLLIEMPVVGQLTTKFPAKYIVAFGWLALAVAMYLFHQTHRSEYQLPSQPCGCGWRKSVGLRFLFVPISLAGYIGLPADKEQQRLGHDQFHAQHRQQRGNVHGDDIAGAARAVPPVDAVVSCHKLRSGVSESGERR